MEIEVSQVSQSHTQNLPSAAFWHEAAQQLNWLSPYTSVSNVNYHAGQIRWFDGGMLNIATNCIDRHLSQKANQIAIMVQNESITYDDLFQQVCKTANALKALGLQKGEVLAHYLAEPLQTIISMLACARLGLVHAVIDNTFSAQQLAACIQNGMIRTVVSDHLHKKNIDKALQLTQSVTQVLVFNKTEQTPWDPLRDVEMMSLVHRQSIDCPAVPMNAEDPLFIIYTINENNKAQGFCYTTAGYALWALTCIKKILPSDNQECIGCEIPLSQISAHTFGLYGPLLCGLCIAFDQAINKKNQPYITASKTELQAQYQKIITPSNTYLIWGGADSGAAILINGEPMPGLCFQIHQPNNQGIGELLASYSWPAQARTLYGNHQGFKDRYLKSHPGFYNLNTKAQKDNLGKIQIKGVD